MEDVAGWVAPAATMLAALVTAANLGTRITGWGFVIFLVGSIAWSIVAVLTHQPNLLWSNLFLTAVNVLGIWRWLGRQARLDDGAKAASARSASAGTPTLFSAAMLQGNTLAGTDGATIGRVAGAMAECGSGRIVYLVVGEGGTAGLGERLHMLPWEAVRISGETLAARLSVDALKDLPQVTPDDWPERVPDAHG